MGVDSPHDILTKKMDADSYEVVVRTKTNGRGFAARNFNKKTLGLSRARLWSEQNGFAARNFNKKTSGVAP